MLPAPDIAKEQPILADCADELTGHLGHTPDAASKIHSFPLAIAKEHGDAAAVVLKCISHQVAMAEKARRNYRDGKYWFYDSLEKIATRFGYISRSTVADILQRLKRANYIEIRCFNRLHIDRTCWYTVPADIRAVVGIKLISFRSDDANCHGISGAVLLWNLSYWIQQCRLTNPRYDWHPMSPTTLARCLPYSVSTIKRTLRRLLEEGVIEDRPRYRGNTTAYRLVDERRVADHRPLNSSSVSHSHSDGSSSPVTESLTDTSVSELDAGGSKPNAFAGN